MLRSARTIRARGQVRALLREAHDAHVRRTRRRRAATGQLLRGGASARLQLRHAAFAAKARTLVDCAQGADDALDGWRLAVAVRPT